MSLPWAVLALLLLLPHSINSDTEADKKLKEFKDANCPDPWEYDCDGGKCTLYCFTYTFCEDSYPQADARHIETRFDPKDTRLLPTAVSMLTVDDQGRIEATYINNHTSKWYRDRVGKTSGKTIRGHSLLQKFSVGLDEAKKKAAKFTDMILYMGSDFADSYEYPTYKFDERYLHLKNGAAKITSNLYTNSAFPICIVYNGRQNQNIKMFTSPLSAKDPDAWISSPGIYRLNFASGRMTQLNYDPIMSAYLM